MYHIISNTLEEFDGDPFDLDLGSLVSAFSHVKDGRKARGKRYPLNLILALVLLGKLAGETSLSGILQWIEERRSLLKWLLGWPRRFPVQSTVSEALALCDGHEVARVIAQVVLKARGREQCGEEPSRLQSPVGEEPELIHTAMDGRDAARNAWTHESRSTLSAGVGVV